MSSILLPLVKKTGPRRVGTSDDVSAFLVQNSLIFAKQKGSHQRSDARRQPAHFERGPSIAARRPTQRWSRWRQPREAAPHLLLTTMGSDDEHKHHKHKHRPVWKSDFRRPRHRCCLRNRACSIAWRFHTVDDTLAHWLISTGTSINTNTNTNTRKTKLKETTRKTSPKRSPKPKRPRKARTPSPR